MPAEPIDPAGLETIDLPQPAWVASQPRLRLNLGLRQIMVLLVYCSLVSLAGRSVYDSSSPFHIAVFGILIGLGIAYAGLWLAVRTTSFAFVGWILFIIGATVASAMILGLLTVPLIPLLIGVIIHLHLVNRRNQQAGLLWVLAVAAAREIPLAPGVEAYAQQTRGIYRDRAHTLAALLLRGQALSTAVDWIPRIVPWDAPILIRAGEKTGRLAHGLQQAAATQAKRDHALRDVFGRVGYVLIVLTTAQLIVGFVAYFILPKFGAIFADFSLNLPQATTWLIVGSQQLVVIAPFFLLAEVVVGTYLLFALGGRGLQGLPIIGRLLRSQHKALILRTLAMAVDAGQKLDLAFSLMAESYPTSWVRRKIRKAGEAIRTGASWTDALRYVGLLSTTDVGLLDAATRVGNLAWALRTLAKAGERRFNYRLQLWSHFLFMITTVGLGILVLFVTVALFLPLVDLIERLSQ